MIFWGERLNYLCRSPYKSYPVRYDYFQITSSPHNMTCVSVHHVTRKTGTNLTTKEDNRPRHIHCRSDGLVLVFGRSSVAYTL